MNNRPVASFFFNIKKTILTIQQKIDLTACKIDSYFFDREGEDWTLQLLQKNRQIPLHNGSYIIAAILWTVENHSIKDRPYVSRYYSLYCFLSIYIDDYW